MGHLTFSINVTVDGCIDHQEGIADDETHAHFSRQLAESGAILFGRVTYEMMEAYWPAVARGEVDAPPALRDWATTLETHPKYVVSRTRTDFRWTNSHHLSGDLRESVQNLKDATPKGVLLGSAKLAANLDRLDLIDEYKFCCTRGSAATVQPSTTVACRRLAALNCCRPSGYATACFPSITGGQIEHRQAWKLACRAASS